MSQITTNYVSVGAMTTEGTRILTKSALKRAAADGNVIFDQTGFIHQNNLPGYIEPGDLLTLAAQDINFILSVVGPDPYNNRRWYANVQVGRDGKLKVS